MAHVQGEKSIAGSVKIELADAFLESIPDGFKKKHALSAAFRIWLSIPEEERRAILAAQAEGLTLDDVVENIVNRVLARIHHRSGQEADKVHQDKRQDKAARRA